MLIEPHEYPRSTFHLALVETRVHVLSTRALDLQLRKVVSVGAATPRWSCCDGLWLDEVRGVAQDKFWKAPACDIRIVNAAFDAGVDDKAAREWVSQRVVFDRISGRRRVLLETGGT